MTSYPDSHNRNTQGDSNPSLTAPPITPPAYGPAIASRPTHTGAVAWGIGFIAYIPIPFANLLISGLTQIIVGLTQRKHGGVAAQNGVRAANWGMVQVLWLVGLPVIIGLGVLTGTPTGNESVKFTPFFDALALTWVGLYLLLGLLHLAVTIWGLVVAKQGRMACVPAAMSSGSVKWRDDRQ